MKINIRFYFKTIHSVYIFSDIDKQMAEENRQMGVEQKNKKEYLEKVVYTNRPTAAYFDQFNTSTR